MPIDPPKVPDGGLGPKPGSAQDMERRLNNLQHGHPSSPYNEDGSPKSDVVSLKNIEFPEPDEGGTSAGDRPRPLTDAEHAEHVQEIRGRLDKARIDGLETDQLHTIDPEKEQWKPDRNRAQSELVNDLYDQASDVPNECRAILAGGLGGAGKSTVLEQYAGIDRSQYLTVNPDIIKEEMARRGLIPHVEGLSPMEASELAHEESSLIAKRLALRAQADGKNVLWDVTMATQGSTELRIDNLRSSGYTHIEGIFVDIPVETSVARADARHREGHDAYLAGNGLGGRFVPQEVIRGQADLDWSSVNRRTFETVKDRLDTWSLYDNSVDGGAPVLVDTGQWEEKA